MWTAEEEDLLKQMIAEGMTGAQCAAQLPGKSRNAVIGKVHRMGDRMPRTNRPRSKKTKVSTHARDDVPFWPQYPTLTTRGRKGSDIPKLSSSVEVAAPVSLLELEKHHCRWPVDHDGRTKFCGRSRSEPDPYCEDHMSQSRRGTQKDPPPDPGCGPRGGSFRFR